MSAASNLARRSGSASYYARLGVPLDVQPLLPRTRSGGLQKELWKSLDTKDAREARARLPTILARWHAEFADLRRRREATEADIEAATWEHYQGELEQHRLVRQRLPSADEIESAKVAAVRSIREGDVRDPLARVAIAAEAMVASGQANLTRDMRTRRKAELEKHLGDGETVLVNDAARDLIRREAWAVEPGSSAFREIAERLMRAEVEALRRAEEQDRGDFTGKPVDPAIRAPSPSRARVAVPGESVMELFDVFAADNPRRIRSDTLRMNREIISLFAQHVGLTMSARDIKKDAAREWKFALAKFPIKAAEIREFKGLGFKQIIKENEKLGKRTISDKTRNKYLSALGGFCRWLVSHGYIDHNPVSGIYLDKDDETKVRPYTSPQLVEIFKSPLFVGCRSEDKLHEAGNFQVRDHRYWLPLLSLFTGARMRELAQLLVADVRQDHGRWIVHVTREGDASKTTKTKGSQRVIPLHPELVRLGFVAFHAEAMKRGDKSLFPEMKADARGNMAGGYSRFFGRYVTRIGVKNDATVNFHSFRHGMIDALRRARFRDEAFACLVGHVKANQTGRYGTLADGDLTTRAEMIEAIAYPGLDLSHLYPSNAHKN